MPVVVDVSAAMGWCFEDEATPATNKLWIRVNAEGIIVPHLWPVEIASVLLSAERRKRITAEQSDEFLSILARLQVELETRDCEQCWGAVMTLSRETGLTAYDAGYLELALRRNLPLATRDCELLAIAKERGVEVAEA